MAGKGYDDDAAMATVEAILASEPGTSRRAAIIRTVGEVSLRRIEMKMARRAAGDTGSLRIPQADMDWDPLAVRLGTGETAILAASGERHVWSGLNAREAVAERLMGIREPRLARSLEILAKVQSWLGVAFVVGVVVFFGGATLAVVSKVAGADPSRISQFCIPSGFLMLAASALGLPTMFVELRLEGLAASFRDEARGSLVRHLLTDKALYVIVPSEDGVRWTRSPLPALPRAAPDGSRDVRLTWPGGEVRVPELLHPEGLLAALGNA